MLNFHSLWLWLLFTAQYEHKIKPILKSLAIRQVSDEASPGLNDTDLWHQEKARHVTEGTDDLSGRNLTKRTMP
jgi:hypothetical protein